MQTDQKVSFNFIYLGPCLLLPILFFLYFGPPLYLLDNKICIIMSAHMVFSSFFIILLKREICVKEIGDWCIGVFLIPFPIFLLVARSIGDLNLLARYCVLQAFLLLIFYPIRERRFFVSYLVFFFAAPSIFWSFGELFHSLEISRIIYLSPFFYIYSNNISSWGLTLSVWLVLLFINWTLYFLKNKNTSSNLKGLYE